MTIRENVDKKVSDALDVETRELFPKIYNGFTEADALAQAEDALLTVISKVIYKYFQNRNLQTMNEEVVTAFEDGLGLPSAGSLDARRTAVISRINARFINNDQTIESRAKEAANNNTIKVNADSQALTAEVTTATNSSTATFEELITALKAIRGLIPQNLEAYAADRSAKAKTWQAYGAARTTVSINAGRVEPLWGVCVFYDYDMSTNSGNRVQYVKIMKEVLGYSLGEAKAIIDRVNETQTFVTIRYKTDGITSYTYENTLASYSATRAKVKACYDYVAGSFSAVDGCFGIYKDAPTITEIQRLYRSDPA